MWASSSFSDMFSPPRGVDCAGTSKIALRRRLPRRDRTLASGTRGEERQGRLDWVRGCWIVALESEVVISHLWLGCGRHPRKRGAALRFGRSPSCSQPRRDRYRLPSAPLLPRDKRGETSVLDNRIHVVRYRSRTVCGGASAVLSPWNLSRALLLSRGKLCPISTLWPTGGAVLSTKAPPTSSSRKHHFLRYRPTLAMPSGFCPR